MLVVMKSQVRLRLHLALCLIDECLSAVSDLRPTALSVGSRTLKYHSEFRWLDFTGCFSLQKLQTTVLYNNLLVG